MGKLNLEPHPTIGWFFKSKRHPKVYVNRYGVCIDFNGNVLSIYYNRGYPHTAGGAIHRHVAETFLKIPPDLAINKRQVNHKNGIKTNNHRTNLEWTDARGNSLHALYTGLRPMNKPVLVKDLRTGEFMEFFSIQDTARFHGLNASEIMHALKPKFRGKVWKLYYGIIRKGETWPAYPAEDIGVVQNGFSKEILAENTVTGERVVYSGYRLFQKHVAPDIKGNTLKQRLHRAKLNGAMFAYVGDYKYTNVEDLPTSYCDGIPVVKSRYERPDLKKGFKRALRVCVFNTMDDSETVFSSLRVCCNELNISFSTTQQKLVDKRFRVVGNWLIIYEGMSHQARNDLSESLLTAGTPLESFLTKHSQ